MIPSIQLSTSFFSAFVGSPYSFLNFGFVFRAMFSRAAFQDAGNPK